MTNTAVAFRESHPDLFFLAPGDPVSLEQFLKVRRVLDPTSQVIAATKAGDGNMNCTVRVATTDGPLIVKQARPWVEKYPQFDAPWDRACREAEFYRAVAGVPQVTRMMPRLIDFDPVARVLVLEEVGDNSDDMGPYGGESLLHGDFFPGSLLRTQAGPRVIDLEFACFGPPEFDVAVFLAHLILSNQPPTKRRRWLEAYDPPAGFDHPLMLQLAGVEIMRRLIGYAQLPVRGLKPKGDLLELSRTLVLRPGLHLVEAA